MIAVWIVVGLLAAYVVAELLARAAIRRGGWYVWAPGSRLHMHLEPGVIPSQGPFVRFEINRDGERGDDPPADPDAAYRVLVAGGSAVECYFLDQPQSWPEVLKRELSKPERLAKLGRPAVHVGNVGRSLIGTEFIDLIFERIFPRYRRLDCVVFMVGASNVVNWLMRKTPAVIPDDAPEPSEVYDLRPDGKYGFRPRRSALRELIKRQVTLRWRPKVERRGAGKKLAAARAMRRRAETILVDTPDPAPMLDHFERKFRALLRRTRAKAGRVVVARQPWFDKDYDAGERAVLWHGAQGQPYVEDVKTYYDFPVVSRLMELVDARMARVAEEEGVEHLDLRSGLEHSLRTFYDFLHFTPEGAEAVGRRLAAFLAGDEAPSPGAAVPRPDAHAAR
ncbi:MAG TPA: hypothetical protein VEI02_03875 [Planctomycetota bacterium]|nr:hypothetical protein [Planctomycetota bacterium]